MSLSRLPVVGYGKVPCGPEFFRLENQPDLSTPLRRWLDEGHQSLAIQKKEGGEEERGGPVETRGYYWGLVNPGKRFFLVGEIRPSRDRAGRRFPVAMAAVVPMRYFANRFPIVPFAFKEVWERISRALDDMAGAAEEKEVYEVFSRLNLGLSQSPRRLRKQFLKAAQEERITSVGGSAGNGESRERVARILGNLGESLKPFLRSRRSDLGIGLRLPLAASLDQACLHTSFWLEFIAKLVRTRRLSCSFFLPRPDQDGKGESPEDLYLYFREVGPREYCWLFGGVGEGALHDLMAPGGPDPKLSRKEVLDESQAALLDLLNTKWVP